MPPERNGLRLGWLGTGRMGAELVRRLLAAGCDVAVYNRTRSKAEPLAAHGAKVVSTAAELASRDIVFATVGTPRDLSEAVLGDGGLMSGEIIPAILVDCSTISADVSAQIREQLGARGTELLAAPVMGNPRVAAAGKLTLAVSGPEQAYDKARPYLDLLGAGATYVGEGELARIVKLCHNLFLGVVTQSLAEVTVLAQKSGVSRAAFLTCLNNSVMGSQFTRYKSPAFVNLDFHPTFTARLLRKDFDLGLAAAREQEVPLPVASLVHQIVQSLVGHGYGEQDFAALVELEAQSAGLHLESENQDISDGLDPADTNEANAVP
ncbi:MAG TPA: NAD(P)-dependent oxidoreductase [Streptosporangiaceae bacterium]|jgi:3-hydroxyisobutyrate dehydrogenase-like beta-hydroxyacid dehydrogenase|nr:NAD(P)-dependent oxidoreductase [Streptosporangiaceae bacterium]